MSALLPSYCGAVIELTHNNFFIIENTNDASNLSGWLAFGFVLFSLGLFGIIFNYKNFLITMIAVELIYLGVICSFIFYGIAYHDPRGPIYALALLILAACESAIGLGILIVLHRFGRSVSFDYYQQLGG